jgi:hypothetical protein
VLDRAVAGWRGITDTPADTRQLQTIRRELGISRPRPKKEPATPDASLSHQPHSMLVKSCAQCRFYTSAGRLPACPTCGAPIKNVMERRQRFEGGFRTKKEAEEASSRP